MRHNNTVSHAESQRKKTEHEKENNRISYIPEPYNTNDIYSVVRG